MVLKQNKTQTFTWGCLHNTNNIELSYKITCTKEELAVKIYKACKGKKYHERDSTGNRIDTSGTTADRII